MSDWDEMPGIDGSAKQDKTAGAGGWDAAMTIVALLSVAAVSFLTAWLTKDVPSRPFWMLGLDFSAPVVALLLSVFLKEKVSSSMTPSTSRKAQFTLALCSILAAGLVGCFCQVSNTEAKTVQEITHEGWSDLLIVLDKSGSMDSDGRNEQATKAVQSLLREMDDDAQVAMLIDVDWEYIPLEKRKKDFGKLADQRDELIRMAGVETGAYAYFTRSFRTACEMLDRYDGDAGNCAILVISDGNDVLIDSDERFSAAEFEDELTARNIKVIYLYVDPNHVDEMDRLARNTGGESVYISDLGDLKNKTREVAKVQVYETVYKDALRDIDESETAKAVTGVLLLLLGLLVGFSLTVMFSLQGQKRLQTVLSPLMAVLSFAILAFGKDLIPVPWVREGIAFSLFGVVLMRKNRSGGFRSDRVRVPDPAESGMAEPAAAEEW